MLCYMQNDEELLNMYYSYSIIVGLNFYAFTVRQYKLSLPKVRLAYPVIVLLQIIT